VLKPEKCQFRTTEVDYLGLKISPGCIGMDPVKVSGVTDWPTPQNVKQVQRFLGFCNFYRRFVADYADITRPLERLKGKDVAWRWGVEEQAAFDGLKEAFVQAPVLMMPDMNAPFRVETDASDFAMGAILSQADEHGDWRPVAYFSKALQPAERNYDVHDKELLSVVRALEMWRPYLEGSPHRVDIFSDHRNLEFFMTTRDLNRRQARWSLFLNRFNFVIIHRPGRLSAGPDGLSRRADHEVPAGSRDNIDQRILPPERLGPGEGRAEVVDGGAKEQGDGGRSRRIKRAVVVELARCAASEVVERVEQTVLSDAAILERIRVVARSDPKLEMVWGLPSAPASIKSRLKEFVVDDGLVRFNGLVYVPDDDEVKRQILQLYHDSIPAGHPGRANTLALISRNYYWPHMSEFVNRYVDGCFTCQKTKPRRQKPYGPLQPLEIPDGPWQHITTDYVGPLPVSNGYDAVQVICDKLTKRAHFLPTHSTDTAEDMCDVFMTRVWPLHGTPKKIVSDRGPQFIARYTARMWERMGIKRALSTAHHPQTDGQTERANQELEVYLRAYVDFYQDDWADWLPFAEFAFNNRVNAATGMSPFYAEYGYHPTFSIDPVNSQSVPKADDRLDRLHEIQQELTSLLELACPYTLHLSYNPVEISYVRVSPAEGIVDAMASSFC
jgi:transposase InsO family protein